MDLEKTESATNVLAAIFSFGIYPTIRYLRARSARRRQLEDAVLLVSELQQRIAAVENTQGALVSTTKHTADQLEEISAQVQSILSFFINTPSERAQQRFSTPKRKRKHRGKAIS